MRPPEITADHLVRAMDHARVRGTLAAAMSCTALAIALIATAEVIARREAAYRTRSDLKRRSAGDQDSPSESTY